MQREIVEVDVVVERDTGAGRAEDTNNPTSQFIEQ